MKSDYLARIEAARDDVDALWVIEQELQGISEPWARPLHIQAVVRRTNLQRAMNGSPAAPHWLTRYDLCKADGRPLYQYRVTSARFELMQADLKARAARMGVSASQQDAALFVIWASEWFRRRYRGGQQRWADLGGTIGLHLDQAGWRKLADDGLRYWKIEALHLHGMHYRLAAIARQGGFPVAALEGAASAWASQYLQLLVRRLLGESQPTIEIATRLAGELDQLIPEIWRNDEMRAVSAELGLAVVMLRREAEAGGITSGALVSAWLEKHRPNWRDQLPLAIDAGGGQALVDGLLAVAPLKGGGGAIRAQRALTVDEGGRREGIELSLDGVLETADGADVLKGLSDEWSRLRLFPSGQLARYVSGELAVAEPSEDGRWTARSTSSRLRFDVPFDTPITLELWGSGRRVAGPFTPAGGEPIGAGLLVCEADAEADQAPNELRVLGVGSGGYRAEPLYLDVPESWSVKKHDTDAREPEAINGVVLGRRLYRVRGAVLVGNGGDQFLVRAGQAGDQRDSLSLTSDRPHGCTLADQSDLRSGSPKALLIDGARKRPPRPGEIWWRSRGSREWLAYTGSAAYGPCEFAWRDATTGHIRARLETTLLPEDFAITRKRHGEWVEVAVSGWPHEVSVPSGVTAGPGAWRFRVAESSRSYCEVFLAVPNRPTIALCVGLPHMAWISHWQEGPVRRQSLLSISTLNRYVARVQGRSELVAELLDANGQPVPQGFANWSVEDELPLSLIVDDVAALLRPYGGIDAKVRLDFHDAHNNFWFVSEFDHKLRSEPRGLVPERAIVDDEALLCGRDLGNAAKEVEFGPYGLEAQLNHRPFELPPLNGSWLVYLRSNGRVLSRPMVVSSVGALTQYGPLGQAMALSGRLERLDALRVLADEVVNDPNSDRSRLIVRELIELAVSLDGLPPVTFDVFGCLETHPLLGPLMLFTASDEEVEKLLRLADGLPFLWALISKSRWDHAFNLEGSRLIELLPDQIPTVATVMNGRRNALAEYEPALAPLLGFVGKGRDLKSIAIAFLNRSEDRVQANIRNPFRPSLAARLPSWNFGTDYWRALDAPLIAAQVALGKIESLTLDQLICVKSVARQHPRYFAEAFAWAFEEGRLDG